MKNLTLFIVLVTLIPNISLTQQKNFPDPQPLFMALIVSDIDKSLDWYEGMFGFELVNRVEMEDRGIIQANIKTSSARIELIQLRTAISPVEALKDYPGGTRLQGFFKFGFGLRNFDEWIPKLEDLGIEFMGTVVSDPVSEKKTVIVKDPDGNRIQLFEY